MKNVALATNWKIIFLLIWFQVIMFVFMVLVNYNNPGSSAGWQTKY